MSRDRRPLVVVMGVSGSGKSSVGRLLADRLDVEYADGDDLHPASNVAAMRAGHALTDELRRPWLESVAAWLAAHDADGGVIACSALKRSYRDLLVAAAPRLTFLHLTGDPGLIRSRMQSREHFMPDSLLDSQLAALEPLAADEDHVVLEVTETPERIVEEFLAAGGR